MGNSGTGLNKHCKYLLLQFAFETLGMERVSALTINKKYSRYEKHRL
jgi:RimJ/RimL family protein N-acetyltransferase